MKGISQYFILMTLLVISTQAQPPERDGIDANYEKNGKRLMDQSVRLKEEPTRGTLHDWRDGQEYSWARVGKLKWMARNLDFKTGNSSCYGNDARNCDALGRLYEWSAARNACPKGWHLPSDGEWMYLLKFVEKNPKGYPKDAEKSALPGWIKALASASNALDDVVGGIEEATDNLENDKGEMEDRSGIEKPEVASILKYSRDWYANGNGVDAFRFSALPGGKKNARGDFEDGKKFGYWWSSGSSRQGSPHVWAMSYGNDKVAVTQARESEAISIRCVQD